MSASPILEAAKQRRAKRTKELENMLAAATARGATALTDAESRAFEKLAAQIKDDDAQIKTLKREAKRLATAARAAATMTSPGAGRRGAYITSEAMTYSVGEPHSYFRDLACVTAAQRGWTGEINPGEAQARLNAHRKEVEIEARSDDAVRLMIDEMRMTPASLREMRVNPNTTAGTGGEFVPPLWAMSQYAAYARPGRVIANRIPTQPLPPGIDVINIPKIKGGSSTAVQAAQGNAVSSTDITTSTVAAAVVTIAGQQDISMQLLEQSPLAMDGVIYQDLMADYDQRLDLQVISGSGVNGQHLGVLAQSAAAANSSTSLNADVTKINAVTCASIIFFDGAVTSFTQYRSLNNAALNIETLRYASPTAIWAHPRRIASWAHASDASIGRPLFTRYGLMNGLGQPTNVLAQGVTGEINGIEVVKDANMPTTCSTGSITSGTGDCLALVKEDDMLLYEGTMRLRALPEVLSGTLQVRFQAFCYSAFAPHRYPPSVSLITGTTGLAAAAF